MREKDEFARSFQEIQPKFSRLLTRLLNEADLSLPQFAVLNQLVDLRTLSMTEVSRRLHITKPAVTHHVDRLEKRALLKRIPHATDRRIFILEILPKGERIIRKTQAYFLKLLLKTLRAFRSQERKTIRRFYALLSRTLDQR